MKNKSLIEKAHALIYREKYRKALKLLKKYRGAPDEDVDWLRIEAMIVLGEFQQAADVFRQCLDHHGDTPERWSSYVGELVNVEEHRYAALALEDGLAAHSNSQALLLQKADLLRSLGQYSQAMQVAGAIPIADQDDAFDWYYERGTMISVWALMPDDTEETVVGKWGNRYSRQLLEAAVSDFTSALAITVDASVLLQRAELLSNLNRYDEAIADIDRILETLPSDYEGRDHYLELRDAYAGGPENERHTVATLIRESASLGTATERTAMENIVNDVVEEAADKVLEGDDLEAALEDLANEDHDTWAAISVARSIYNLGNLPKSDWVAVPEANIPPRALRWAAATQSSMEQLGFRDLGDFEDVALTPVIGQRIVARLMLSRDGSTWAALYKPQVPWPGLFGWLKLVLSGQWFISGIVELESATQSGHCIVTNNAGNLDPFNYGPDIDKCGLKAKTSVSHLLDTHIERQQRYAKNASDLILADNLDDIFKQQENQRLTKNAFRHAIDHYDEDELKQVLGNQFKAMGEPVRLQLQDMAARTYRKAA
ncbi:MAG TPA: hypothetical protein DD979_16240 [Gammaproteobacteria bacterium]|nr:hypothetical protein [Gammaproteobacteria bacterium]